MPATIAKQKLHPYCLHKHSSVQNVVTDVFMDMLVMEVTDFKSEVRFDLSGSQKRPKPKLYTHGYVGIKGHRFQI